jgi:uncharacterized protein YheU (UPF0270 family)
LMCSDPSATVRVAIRGHIDYSEHVPNRQELEMPSTTLNQLVRDRILAEGPQIGDEYEREEYVDNVLDQMTRAELLQRISDALDVIQSEQSVRLGI